VKLFYSQKNRMNNEVTPISWTFQLLGVFVCQNTIERLK